jgi:transcriptional regulator with XRE-family HTH domain
MTSELWQRIRALRRYTKLSGEAFGAELGVSKAAVSQWESSDPRKRTVPELKVAVDMKRKFGASLDWLLDDQAEADARWWEKSTGETGSCQKHESIAERLADTVAGMQPARWRSVRAQLDDLAGRPEMRDDVLQELIALLQAEPGKPRAAA